MTGDELKRERDQLLEQHRELEEAHQRLRPTIMKSTGRTPIGSGGTSSGCTRSSKRCGSAPADEKPS